MCAHVTFRGGRGSIPIALRRSAISRNQGTVPRRRFPTTSRAKEWGSPRRPSSTVTPGPAHVLELATQLHLTADQKVKTEALFKRMQGRAIALGKELVEEERTLNHIFASHSVTPEALGGSLARIAKLQAQVRQVHLEAHLEQTALLSREKVSQYNRLRGYGATQGDENHEERRH
jgi:hypothetical protein